MNRLAFVLALSITGQQPLYNGNGGVGSISPVTKGTVAESPYLVAHTIQPQVVLREGDTTSEIAPGSCVHASDDNVDVIYVTTDPTALGGYPLFPGKDFCPPDARSTRGYHVRGHVRARFVTY